MSSFKFFVTIAFATLSFSTLTHAALTPAPAPAPAAAPATPLTPPLHKKVICTATINSTEEGDTFRKYLHPDYFEFVELLKNKLDTEFLSRSCKSGQPKCDVVLISGHFGGGFTDNKDFFLPVEDMESISCRGCPSVLGGASMVYLFGCNTLASKELDGRTPEDYYNVLVNEVGLEPAEARATVAVRYSAIGDSFNDRLRRIFKGSAVIGGFGSKAPLGSQIQPALEGYFRSLIKGLKSGAPLEDWQRRAISEVYYNELDNLKAGQANGQNQKIFESRKRLQPKLARMVGGSYTDVPGIEDGTVDGLISDKICSVDGLSGGGRKRLDAIESIINTHDRTAVLQMLPYLLDISKRGGWMGSNEKAMFARLSTNPQLHDLMVGPGSIVEQLNGAPDEQTRTVDLAVNLGWLTVDQQNQYYRNAAVYVWNNPNGLIQNKNLMNKINDELQVVQASEVKSSAFKGDAVWVLIASRHADQPEWVELAKANFPVAFAYYRQSYETHKAAMDRPNIPDELREVHAAKIKEIRQGVESVCTQAMKIKAIAPDIRELLAPQSDTINLIAAKKCQRLL